MADKQVHLRARNGKLLSLVERFKANRNRLVNAERLATVGAAATGLVTDFAAVTASLNEADADTFKHALTAVNEIYSTSADEQLANLNASDARSGSYGVYRGSCWLN